MKKLNQHQREIVERYFRAQQRREDLYDAYRAPSRFKADAWRDIERNKEELNGHGLYVVGHNTTTFSCAFWYKDNEGFRLRYFTRNNTYDFPITFRQLCYGVEEVA